MKKVLKITAIVIVSLTVILFVAFGGYWHHNMHWYDKYQDALDKAGAEEKQFDLQNGNVINYGEVKNDKPALLLIHGQMSIWGIPPSEIGCRNANEQRNIKKEKYAIQPEGAEITYLAGLYRFEEHRGVQIPMFAVITRESVEPVSSIHVRMPLILGKDSLREWVRPDGDPGRIAKKALTNMVMEKAIDYPEPKPAFMQI